MASEIRVNSIKNRSGLSTVTWNDEGLNVVGVITATKFVGDVTGDVTGNVTGNLTGNVTGTASQLETNATGANLTLSGNLGVGGTLTYEDVTRVDSVGLSTFREGLEVGPLAGIALTAYKDGSIRTSGVVTATSYYGSGANLTGISAGAGGNTPLDLNDGVKANFGTDDDLRIYAGSGNSFIQHQDTAAGDLYIDAEASNVYIRSGDGGTGAQDAIVCQSNSKIQFKHAGTTKFETTSGGAKVTGDLEVTGSGGGITQADFWRLTANMQANQLPIASNLARVNTYGFGDASKIGSGMTQSSGVWTFPATGLYLVQVFGNVYSANHSQTNTLQIRHTADGGGNWASASVGAQGIYDYGIDSFGHLGTSALIDVTSTSNVKVAFNFGAGQGGEYIQGHSVYTYTGFLFIRLG